MAVSKPSLSPALLIMFLAFSFGTGLLLVTASQQNTEGRSKAFGTTPGPYPPNSNACPFVLNDGSCSDTPQGGCSIEGRPAYGSGGSNGGRDFCCEGFEPANIGGDSICHKLGSLSPSEYCVGLGANGGTDGCQWCPNQDFIVPIIGPTHCRGVGEKTFVERMVEIGKKILEPKAIQYGSDVVCPEGTTEHRGGKGLVWCE